jgi:hypothetical protein
MKKHLLPLYFTIYLFFFTFSSFAQTVGFRISMIKPVREFGYTFKADPALEFTKQYVLKNKNFNIGFNIGFYYLQPRQDTFKTLIYEAGNSPPIITMFQTIKYYFVIPVGGNIEYVKHIKKIHPAVGMSLYLYNTIYYYYYRMTGIEEEDKFVTTSYLGIMPYLSLTYDISNNFALSAGMGRSFALNLDSFDEYQTYWKPYITIVHKLLRNSKK